MHRILSIFASRRAVGSATLLASALLLSSCGGGEATRRAAAAAPRPRPGPGAPVWRHTLHGWPDRLVSDQRGLVVTAAASVTALDFDGTPRWTSTVEGVAPTDPAVTYGRVFVGGDRRLVALDREDGSTRWEADVPGTIVALGAVDPPAGPSRVLDATRDGLLEARDVADGSVRWQARDAGGVSARPVFSDDRSIVVALWSGSGPDHAVLRAIEVESGSVRWQRQVARGASAPVVTQGLVVLGAGDDNFRSQALAFDLSDGTPMSSASLPGSFEAGIVPGIAGGSVVLVDHFGTVSKVDARAGRVEWQTKLNEPVVFERPVVSEDLVVVTTYAREIVWLDRHTGRIIRRWQPDGVPAEIVGGDGRLVVALRHTEPGRLEAYAL